MHCGAKLCKGPQTYEIARWDNVNGMAVWAKKLNYGIWLQIKTTWKHLLEGKLNRNEWELFAQAEQQDILRGTKGDQGYSKDPQDGWRNWDGNYDGKEEQQWRDYKWSSH